MHERAPFHIKALHGFTGSVGNLVFVVFELFVLFFYQRAGQGGFGLALGMGEVPGREVGWM